MNRLFYFCLILFTYNAKSAIIYVTPNGTGSGNSWNNAYAGTSLQLAINTALIGDTIWVACGTYKPTAGLNRTISFSLKNGVAIYGSFAGNESNLQQRTLTCGSCSILSGDIGISNNNTDNSYHVLFNTGNDSTAVIDGFVIREGNANGNVYDEIGGGILNNGNFGSVCSPTIRNCIITANQAHYGGGVFNNGGNNGNANPNLSNCIISNNEAYDGGGIDNYGYSGNASPQIINCIVVNNHASLLGGGGIYCWGGGGGNASPLIQNCTLVNNTSDGYGGGIVTDNSNINSGNSGTSNPIIRNTILWNNVALGFGPQFYRKGSALFNAVFCCIDTTNQYGANVISGIATSMQYTNPSFINGTNIPGSDNCLLNADDGLLLQNSSTLINTGNAIGAPQTDISGMLRLSLPDIGAYETNIATSFDKENKTLLFEIYPNPTPSNCIINIEDATPHVLQIYNMQGTLLHELQISPKQLLNLEIYPKGIYLIVIDKQFYKRIIKL